MRKVIFLTFLFTIVVSFTVFAAPQDTLRKAMVHIVTMQDENGTWSRLKGEFPPEAEPTALAVKVLTMNGMALEKAEKGVAFLLKDQRPDGSWGNNTAGTAFTIIALKQANTGEDAINKGIQYLRDVQDNNGGFKRLGKEGAPISFYTAVVLTALKEAEVPRNDPAVRMAIDWLMGCQNTDGGYPMLKGTPSIGPATAWVVKALLAYGAAPTTPFVQDAVDYLVTTQKSQGGFAPALPAAEDPEATAYALMALSKYPDKKMNVHKGTEYLGKAQQPDGAFISTSPIQFNKIAKKNTQTTCFVAWALSELAGKGAGGTPTTPLDLRVK